MVTTPIKPISLAEFLSLPETKPAQEYVNGKIIPKPMPKGKHSFIQTQLSAKINAYLHQQRLGWAFSELRCTFGDRSIIPDISVFIHDRIPRDPNGEIADIFNIAPDWTIEVLSPEQSPVRVIKNILYCLDHGTQMGWLIDPREQSILIYLPSEQVKIIEQPTLQIPAPDFAKDFPLTVPELFGWLLT